MTAYTTNKTDSYQIITDRIIDLLEQGVAPWQKPWRTSGSEFAPCNLVSKRQYNGINYFLLSAMGYSSPYWLTFKQAKDLGGHVRKGEKGVPVVFWKILEKDNPAGDIDPETGEVRKDKIFFLKHFTVFNTEQCEGISDCVPEYGNEEVKKPEHERIEIAEKVVADMPNPPAVSFGGNKAYYVPSSDSVRVPCLEDYDVVEEYYSTLFHELGHSTGHQKRLARKGIMEVHHFGDNDYSREELVAEMTATFLCGYCGIEKNTINNSASYLQNWIKVLKGDKKLVVIAASQAQKAANYILGKKEEAKEAE